MGNRSIEQIGDENRIIRQGQLQTARSSLSPRAKPLPDWLASHLARMEAHRPVETLSMERMVTDSGRTHEHLARVMRERMEMSPSEWIRQRRVRWAAHLLALTDKSIIEVSMDCGFNHLSGFYRAFKEHKADLFCPYSFSRRAANRGSADEPDGQMEWGATSRSTSTPGLFFLPRIPRARCR